MRRILMLPLLTVALVGLAKAQGARGKGAEAADEGLKEVLATEAMVQRAAKKQDYDTEGHFWDDDLVYTNELGQSLTKSQLLKYLNNGLRPGGDPSKKQHFYTVAHSQVRVRMYGDTAVLTAYSTSKLLDRGRWSLGPRRLTKVYAKRNGRWVIVVRQPVLIVKQ